MPQNNKSIAIFTDYRFWLKKQGADFRICNQFSIFSDYTKYLIFYGTLSEEDRVVIQKDYHVKEILCIKSKRVEFRRIVRKALSILNLNFFYELKRPFPFSSSFKEKVAKFLADRKVETLLVNYIWYSKLFLGKETDGIYKIVETHDSQHLFCKQNLLINRKWPSYVTKEEEFELLKKFNLVLAVSSYDKKYFDEELTNVFYLPYLAPLCYTAPRQRERLHLGFIGGKMDFNAAAAEWFIQKVLPCLSNAEFHVYGSVCEKLSQAENVVLHGFVRDSKEIYSNCDIMVNPTFVAGGIKTKNLECMGHGVPLLTTVAGSCGMEEGGAEGALFVSDEPQKWVEEIARLSDFEQRNAQSQKAYAYVKENFSPDKEKEFLQLVEEGVEKTNGR